MIGHPLSSSSIYNDQWHPLCSFYVLDSPLEQPLSRSSLVFPLVLNLQLGIVELCAKILQIMRNDFKDYARTFCQLCAPFSI